ncbi:hypothetical protein NOG67_13340 [Erwinia persicina]|uniref:hypothetical protein n=1 Tax=Erwinia persicina TaxID=55211 RepID=UPI00210716FB|nr:hypothetical protein [Erwinia persicina]MCQ4105168.1 hypothetical protein [Erwinia persicina]UTX11381.1 hypothetical protein NOG67_13340 [Erwinia persicina]
MGKKFQIAKVYKSGCYGIAVDGDLIECQLSTVIDTDPTTIPTLTATFRITEEEAENPIRIEV